MHLHRNETVISIVEASRLRRSAALLCVGRLKALWPRPDRVRQYAAGGTSNFGWAFRVFGTDHCYFGDQVRDAAAKIGLFDRVHGVFC
jgi:hypothetical protein